MGSYERGAQAALALYSKEAATATPHINPAPVAGSAIAQAATQAVPLHSQVAKSIVGGATGGVLNAMMAPPGDRLRQGAIGFASDAVGSALGPWGMLASPAINMALQHFTTPREEKTADHADDRLKERIRAEFPPDALKQLREQAKDLELAPGRYYLPMKDKAGTTAAIAAFKTVGPNDKLVLATVLKPKSTPPPGTSLSHLMKQPLGAHVGTVDASPKTYTIRKNSDGVLTCTCKDFKFRKRAEGGNCKHIEAHLAKEKTAAEGKVRQSGEPIDNEEAPKDTTGTWQKYMPLAAGAVGALGAYKGLRTPTFSKHPALRKMQEKAQQGFHRVVHVGSPDTHIPKWMVPKVNDQTGKMNLVNKAKLWALEGPEAIPVYVDPNTQQSGVVGQKPGVPIKTKGVVQGRHFNPVSGGESLASIIHGGSDIEGSRKTQDAVTNLMKAGKGVESEFFQKHTPESVPGGMQLNKVFKRMGTNSKDFETNLGSADPEGRADILRHLKKNVDATAKERGWDDYAMKRTMGSRVNADQFPRKGDNWQKELKRFQKTTGEDAWGEAMVDSAMYGGDAEHQYVKSRGALKGQHIDDALQNPKGQMIQEWMPNSVGEYRVHGMAGTAPENLMVPRWNAEGTIPHGMVDAAQALRKGSNILRPGEKKQLSQFVENALQKLPKSHREGFYGFDVGVFRDPKGVAKFKIIEANPAPRAGPGTEGSYSGFSSSQKIPWIGHSFYRAATGRHSQPVAALGALGAGGAAGGLAHMMMPKREEEEEAPHPAG